MASVKNLFDLLMEGGEAPLKRVYDKMSERMAIKKPANRVQPDPSRIRVIDQDYKTPAPFSFPEDLSAGYPRNPNPMALLPKRDRARSVVENRKQISDQLTKKIVDSGILGSDARYFYHSDGPIYRAAINSGLSEDEAVKFLDDFSKYFAATSPRTKVEDNIRSASSVMAKQAAGIPHRQIVGGGTIDPKTGQRGISEKGYPMMTGKGGIHGNLIDNVIEYGSIDRATNTKPATFGANMVGNRSGVTVDTHALRGALIAMNDASVGSVPEGFILPKFREVYRKDPSTLTPNMIDDTVGTQVIDIDGRKVDAQTEYPIFADIYHDVAKNLGVEPAEAQALGWFGLGDETNLGSAKQTVSDILDERINVTAQEMGLTPQEVAKLFFKRKIPLLSVGGGVSVGSNIAAPNQAQASQMPSEQDLLTYFARQ